MHYLLQIRKGQSTTTEAATELNIPHRTLRRYVQRSKNKDDYLFYIPNLVGHKPITEKPVLDGCEDAAFPMSWKPQSCVPMFQPPFNTECQTKSSPDEPDQLLSDSLEWEKFFDGIEF